MAAAGQWYISPLFQEVTLSVIKRLSSNSSVCGQSSSHVLRPIQGRQLTSQFCHLSLADYDK